VVECERYNTPYPLLHFHISHLTSRISHLASHISHLTSHFHFHLPFLFPISTSHVHIPRLTFPFTIHFDFYFSLPFLPTHGNVVLPPFHLFLFALTLLLHELTELSHEFYIFGLTYSLRERTESFHLRFILSACHFMFISLWTIAYYHEFWE
jgi:hypothetical protein